MTPHLPYKMYRYCMTNVSKYIYTGMHTSLWFYNLLHEIHTYEVICFLSGEC